MIYVQPELEALSGRLLLMAHDEFVALVPERCAVAARHLLLDTIERTGAGPYADGKSVPELKMFDTPMRGEGYIREAWKETP